MLSKWYYLIDFFEVWENMVYYYNFNLHPSTSFLLLIIWMSAEDRKPLRMFFNNFSCGHWKVNERNKVTILEKSFIFRCFLEAATGGVLGRKSFLKIYNIYRKTSVLASFLYKLACLGACNFIKERLQHRCFLVNITKF